MSTLDENGLVIDRFPDIIEAQETAQRADISTAFVYRDNTIIYQLNSLFASRSSDLAELIEAVYNAKRLSTATGIDLDYLGALKGVPRLGDIPSSTDSQQFVGQAGTTIPVGSLFSNPVTEDRFTNTSQITLSSSSCLDATLEVVTLLNNTDYTVSINGTDYTINSDPTASALGIMTALRDAITADTNAVYTAALVGDTLKITTDDVDDNIAVIVTTYIAVAEVTSRASLESVSSGRIIVNPNSVTQTISTIPGLTSTNNPEQYTIGRLKETDEEYRPRIASGQGNPGLGTVPSIEAYLLANVTNIVDAVVIENATNAVDGEGRPDKSYEVIVTGGADNDIAEAIWFSKGAGIELHGDVTEVYVDPRGRPREVKFTRPTVINVAIELTYTLYDEEAFPGNGEQTMIDTILANVNTLGSGVDLILGRLYGPIYSNVSAGLDSVTLRSQVITTPGDTPVGGSWDTVRIPVDANEFVNVTSVDIYIVSP